MSVKCIVKCDHEGMNVFCKHCLINGTVLLDNVVVDYCPHRGIASGGCRNPYPGVPPTTGLLVNVDTPVHGLLYFVSHFKLTGPMAH